MPVSKGPVLNNQPTKPPRSFPGFGHPAKKGIRERAFSCGQESRALTSWVRLAGIAVWEGHVGV